MNKLKLRFKGIFKLVFLSYILILALAVVFVGIFVKQAESILLDEIARSNLSGLENIGQQIDESLRSIESSSVELAFSAAVSNMVQSQKGYRSANDCYNSVEITKQFWTARLNNKLIENAYIMLYRDECVLSSDGKYSIDEFCADMLDGGDTLSYDTFISLHKDNKYKSYKLIRKPDGTNDIFFMYSLPLGGTNNKAACLGIKLDSIQLESFLLSGMYLQEAELVLLDEQGGIIRLSEKNGDIADEVDWHAVSSGESAHMNLEISGVTYCAQTVLSQVNGWSYALLMPAHIYLSSQNRLNITFLIVICTMSAAVIIASVYLALRQCEPIWKLLDIAGSKAKGDPKYNEYRALESSISNILSENEQLSSENELNSDALRNHYLCQIMQGMVDECEAKTILQRCNLQLQSQGYQVWMIDLDAALGESRTSTVDDVRRILSDTLSHRAEFALTENEGHLFALMNLDENTNMDDIRSEATLVFEACHTLLGGNTDISISDIYIGADRLHEGYMDIKRIADYRKLTGMSGVLLSGTLQYGSGDGSVVYLIETNRLYNLLVIGSYAEARIAFDQLMNELNADGMPQQLIKCNMYGIMHTMSRAFAESDALTQKQYDRFTERLLSCESAQELSTEASTLLEELCKIADAQLPSDTALATGAQAAVYTQASLAESATLYIQQSYTNTSLSVASVAEHLNVAPVTLSREFKKVLNMSVLDYIHHTRLRAAKRLMASSEKSIAIIALETGYTNNVTFIRVFKKYEGITPGQFRDHISALSENT